MLIYIYDSQELYNLAIFLPFWWQQKRNDFGVVNFYELGHFLAQQIAVSWKRRLILIVCP